MTRFVIFCGVFLLLASFAAAQHGVTAENTQDTVSVQKFGYPYFVKNTLSPPEGSSVLVETIDEIEKFEEMFGVGWLMGSEPASLVDSEYFKTSKVVVFVEWGNVPWEYVLRSAVKEGDTLLIKVSKEGISSETATFAPFLMLGMSRADLEGVNKISFDFIPADVPVTETGKVFSLEL